MSATVGWRLGLTLSRPRSLFQLPVQVRKMSSSQDLPVPKVYVARTIPSYGLARLREHFQVTAHQGDHAPSRHDYLACVGGVDAVVLSGFVKVDREFLDAAGPQLKVIATFSVGLDHIDIDLCKERGVKVGYTPGVLTNATAETAIALLLATARKLEQCIRAVRDGVWGTQFHRPMWLAGKDISGSVIGIVGLGRIGLAIAKRLAAFDVSKIVYTGRNPRPEFADSIGAEFVTFDQLLAESDFVIISCSANDSNQGLFNGEAFRKMKRSSILVNIARGVIVDQDALYEALTSGEIGAAGLDVTTPEPLPPSHPLLTLPNCMILPHVGSNTEDAIKGQCDLVVENIIAGLKGEPLKTPVY